MKQHLYALILLMVVPFFNATAQEQNLEIATKNIKENHQTWNLDESDVENMMVSSSVTSDNGLTYLYLNQAHNGIPIRNAIMTVILKNNKVMHVASNFVSHASDKIKNLSKTLTADQAISAAATQFGIRTNTKPTESRNSANKLNFLLPELAKSPIPATLMYELKGDKLILVWNLHIDMKENADYWDYNVDANTGEFVSKDNFTLYCSHHKDGYTHHGNCTSSTSQR